MECEVSGEWCVGRLGALDLRVWDLEGVECLGGLETPSWSVDTVTVASSPTLQEPYCASHSSWHAYSFLIWPPRLELPMQVENIRSCALTGSNHG